MKKLLEQYRQYRLRRALRRIRRELQWWGIDLSDVSDEELTARIACMSEMITNLGIDMKAAAKALGDVARSMRFPFDTPPSSK